MNIKKVLPIAIAASFLLALPSFAEGHKRKRKRKRQWKNNPEMMEKIKKRVRTHMVVELSTELGLNDAETLKLGKAVDAHMEKKHKARESMRTEVDKLRELIEQKKGDAALEAQMKKIMSAKKKKHMGEEFMNSLSFLSVTKRAKAMVMMPKLKHQMHKMMRKGKHGKRGKHGDHPESPEPPFAPDF